MVCLRQYNVYFDEKQVSILVKAVLFSDGSKWDANGKSIREIIPVKSWNPYWKWLIFNIKQTTQDAKYAPTEHDNIWICTCGDKRWYWVNMFYMPPKQRKTFDLLNKDKLKIIEYNNQITKKNEIKARRRKKQNLQRKVKVINV